MGNRPSLSHDVVVLANLFSTTDTGRLYQFAERSIEFEASQAVSVQLISAGIFTKLRSIGVSSGCLIKATGCQIASE